MGLYSSLRHLSPTRRPAKSTSKLRSVKLTGALVIALLLAGMPARADEKPPQEKSGIRLMDVHRALGMLALGAFASSLVIGSASGNLGKLMDPARCCPDGGARLQPWRTVDRALVTTGIVAYLGAASLATYNLTIHDPPR